MGVDLNIKNFEESKNGSELKSNLISLLEALLSDSGYNAADLSGYFADEFVTKDELRTRADEINGAIKDILVSVEEGSTIHDNLALTDDIREQIRQAINDLYKTDIIPTSGDGSQFDKYVDVILDIPNSLQVKRVTSTIVEENGTYEAEAGSAFNSVLVSVPEKTLTTRSITKNGTYHASQDGADGYEYVEVNVTGVGESFVVRFMSDDGQQVLYTALNVPRGGYAVFNGAYPESSVEGEYFLGWNPLPENITQDTDCYPTFGTVSESTSTEIQDSWEVICSNAGAGYPIGSYKTLRLNPFEFYTDRIRNKKYDWTNLLSDSSSIEAIIEDYRKYGNTSLPLTFRKVAVGESGTTSTWVCTYPIYGAQYGWRFRNVATGETRDSNIIAATYPFTAGNSTEDGANNSILAIPFMIDDSIYPLSSSLSSLSAGGKDFKRLVDTDLICWGNSDIRTYINSVIFGLLPDCLKQTIKTVSKKSKGYSMSTGEVVDNLFTRDKLWLPSVIEVFGSDWLESEIERQASSSAVNSLKLFRQSGSMDYSSGFITENPNYPQENVKYIMLNPDPKNIFCNTTYSNIYNYQYTSMCRDVVFSRYRDSVSSGTGGETSSMLNPAVSVVVLNKNRSHQQPTASVSVGYKTVGARADGVDSSHLVTLSYIQNGSSPISSMGSNSNSFIFGFCL